ncbi:MAG TPA: M20 family metallopeptidase [Kofleriaceae bacterium]|nr:M20 family metallopeptidase [Kofleriaceae bacterium]
MNETEQRACDAAARAEAGLLPVLERWVRINSFTSNRAGVNQMADALEADFAPLDLLCTRHPGDGLGDHLVWRTAAWDRRPERRVLLVGHHDTVFPPGAFELFERDGDRVRGPGALDMKGGLLVVRTALQALAEAGALDALPVALVTVGDEEIGSPTSRELIEELARGARAGLVFESGRRDDTIVTRRKGTGGVKVVARGRAAHAGNQHRDGINAIWGLARLIDRLQRLTDHDRGITVNVGLVSGGEAKNTVPAHAECGIDIRFVRAVDGNDLVAAIDRAARAVAEESGVSFAIEGGVRRSPLERSDASAELCRLYSENARRFGMGGGECGLVGGGSDANTVSAVGVPAIDGLGPRGAGFHTHDEYIELSTLVPRAQALIATLLALAAE